MRCAISLARSSISCMVRLLLIVGITACGRSTPTTEQTCCTTDRRVIDTVQAVPDPADQTLLEACPTRAGHMADAASVPADRHSWEAADTARAARNHQD